MKAPSGVVDFTTSSVLGTLSIGSCALPPGSSSTSSCSIQFATTAVGSFTVTASYGGDTFHAPSIGSQTMTFAVVACE